jgi:hypothetical protein
MEEEDKTEKTTGETEKEINKEYKHVNRKEEEEEEKDDDDKDLYFVSSEDEGEEEEEINMDENNIIGMGKKDEAIKLFATDEEDEGNRTNSIVDKNNERAIGKPMKTSEVERGKVTNNDTKSKSTEKKMKVTQNNIPFGHVCDDIAVDDDTPYVRIYCQNVSGIFDREGIGLDSALKEIKQAGADIFTFNETHGNKTKAVARRALRL